MNTLFDKVNLSLHLGYNNECIITDHFSVILWTTSAKYSMTTGKHSFELFRIVSSRSILLISSTEIEIGRVRDGSGEGEKEILKMRK